MKTFKSEKGFTLIEILIALILMSLVTTAIYQLYISHSKTWLSQDLITEMQQNARVSIDTISRDLLMAGYGVTPFSGIETATATEVRIKYRDINATPQFKKIGYKVIGSTLLRNEVSAVSETGPYSADIWQPLADNVTGLSFSYYKQDGTLIAIPTGNEGQIYRIKVGVSVKTSRKDPITGTEKHFTLTTDVRPRNIGMGGGVATDNDPPAKPKNLKVIDPGICNTLRLRWDSNDEVDLAGYIVYYGLHPGDYSSGKVNVGKADNLQYDLTGLTTSFSDGSTVAKYYIAVAAFDSSGNVSEFSDEVGGLDPQPSIRAFGGDNDTTVTIEKPIAPTNFRGVSTGTDGKVKLKWDPYPTAIYPQVTGFRIYRSTEEFTTFPINGGDNDGKVKFIAGEAALNQDSTEFIDGDALSGCQLYYYAIAPVTCDPTLITDSGSDPVNKKYVAGDYAITYGDGAGPKDDSPADSDTSPDELIAPAAPIPFGVRAGWKRVAVSFKQPGNDVDRTCIYTVAGSTPPTLRTNTKDYPLVDGCYQAETGQGVPDSGGSFTAAEVLPGQSKSFWHDSMSVEAPISPDLAESGTYSYTAITFDRCGNASDPASASDTIKLCGEDPPLCSADPANPSCQPDPGKPPAVTGLSAPSCYLGAADQKDVVLAWTGISSVDSVPSTEYNPYDLAGYRILRSSGDPTCSNWSGATLLNPDAPEWIATWSDTSVVEGETYCYRVITTDCPYERAVSNDPVAAEAQIRADMTNIPLRFTTIGPVYPGELLRDEKCTTAQGTCTKDLHRAILTGVSMDNAEGNGSGTSSPSSDFRHNTVTFFLENTSAGNVPGKEMVIEKATVSWKNELAILRQITIGGGRSGKNATLTPVAASATNSVTADAPYTRKVTDYIINSGSIPGLARYVPITFTFDDVDGNPIIDMRNDQLKITLSIRNESTDATTCMSYLTTSDPQTLGDLSIPIGAEITSVTQNEPVAATAAFDVPGAAGANEAPTDGRHVSINVVGNVDVVVTANVVSNTQDWDGSILDITKATLYWVKTDIYKGKDYVDSIPSASWNTVAMSKSAGNEWSGSIVAGIDRRIWYYIVAEDEDGNYDRSPEIGSGYYVFDQSEDPCENTPQSPSTPILLNTPPVDVDAAQNVNLRWTAPTKNIEIIDGENTAIHDLGGFNVYEYYSNDKGASWTGANSGNPIAHVPGTVPGNNYSYGRSTTGGLTPPTTDQVTASYSNGTWLKYKVSAYDRCTSVDTPYSDKESALSEYSPVVVKGTCSAAPSQATLQVNNTPQNNSYDRLDGSVNLSWSANTESDFASYNIFASTDGGTNWGSPIDTIADSATTTKPVTTSASENTVVMYKLVTADKCGLTKESTPVSIVKSCSVPPNAPTGLASSSGNEYITSGGNQNKYVLNWNALSPFLDTASYNVYEYVDGVLQAGYPKNNGTSTTFTSEKMNVAPYVGRGVQFGVTTVDKCGRESGQTTINVYPGTCTTPPNAPTGLTANVTSPTNVVLGWTAPPSNDLAGFYLYESVNGGAYTKAATILGTTPSILYVANRSYTSGNTYSWYVVAFDKCSGTNVSGNSNTVTKSFAAAATCDATNAANIPQAPTWDTTVLCATPYGSGTRRAYIPLLNSNGSTAIDLTGLNVYLCNDGSICSSQTFVKSISLPSGTGDYYQIFDTVPYACGDWYKLSIVDSCGNVSAQSSAW